MKTGNCEVVSADVVSLFAATDEVLSSLTTRTQFPEFFELVAAKYDGVIDENMVRYFVHHHDRFEVLRGQFGGIQVTGGYPKPAKEKPAKKSKAAEAVVVAVEAPVEAAPVVAEVVETASEVDSEAPVTEVSDEVVSDSVAAE